MSGFLCESGHFFGFRYFKSGHSVQATPGGIGGFLNVELPSLANSDVRRFSFSQRCPSVWNALPDTVKMASTVNSFKAAYDKFKFG